MKGKTKLSDVVSVPLIYLKSETFLFPRSGIPGSGHMLCPWATPIWDTIDREQIKKV